MPKADGSLNQRLEQGSLGESEAIEVLTDVATALLDMGSVVVHRDIKPQNILRYQDKWCLADFGIARYTEEGTGTQTYKGHGSSPWLAPERWLNQRATTKSDVYSLGVVAFQLVTGGLPFEGPDFYEQHRSSPPPALSCSPLLSSLIVRMLAKAPDARPSPAKILDELAAANRVVASPAVEKLRAAANKVVVEESHASAAAEADKAKQERRQQLAQSALQLVEEWMKPIFDALDSLPGVKRALNSQTRTYRLGEAALTLVSPQVVQPSTQLPFDVVCVGSISVEVSRGVDAWGNWKGRQHSIWYCDAQAEGEYHWFETAFHNMRTHPPLEPYARSPKSRTHSSHCRG
jgi:serine/threonine-protein kinase